MTATYRGKRENGNAVVYVDDAYLPPRNELVNHSPDGFEWGYSGSGPAQLALALLAHHFRTVGDGDELADSKALILYQNFKARLIAGFSSEGWQLESHVVADTVSLIVREDARRFFDQAARAELDIKLLYHDLDECYRLLER